MVDQYANFLNKANEHASFDDIKEIYEELSRTLNYIWKVPTSPDDRDEIKLAQTIASIQSLLPKYFTKQMRKNVLYKYSLVKTITLAILRVLYYDLTGDAAMTSNIISKEIEERLKIMLMLEDPSIIVDMRINNGFKGTKFDYFWNELDTYFNEIILLIKFHSLYISKLC
ncbi:hypothetical protein GLOIN_2v1804101 [Rhizophagus clarus]|uniref:Uncharacterized protein n=1 Tax=Rhizophagus clarus TaxID=94130 RepID=A0A8H3M6L7_9GLOM|nr:hypothetical protein GLOIN_2v1804101 [Rhizophagus clarus]